jgi:predicted GNAT family acetyltransferase
MEHFTFEENAQLGAFYLYDGQTKLGEVTFRKSSGKDIVINHTFVKKEFEGNGYGKKLVDKVIGHAEANGLNLTATCWFAEKILQLYQK